MKALLNFGKNHDNSQPDLELYGEEPNEEVSINDVIALALYRSRFHEEISNLVNGPNRMEEVNKICKRFGIPGYEVLTQMPVNQFIPKLEKPSDKKKYYDEMSFFSYLIVSLRTDETQRKFVSIETTVFRHRIQQYLKDATLSDRVLSIPKELRDIISFDLNKYYNKNTKNYSIPFEEIFPFIDVTRCVCIGGNVEVEVKNLEGFLTNIYTIYLNKMFGKIRKARIHDSQLTKVIIRMFDDKAGNCQIKERTNYTRVTLEELKTTVRSFPPCMRSMYDTLMKTHKLFHQGRLQFSLFLKGLGLSLDESTKFWRTEMTKGISLDQFEKQYAYNIRYNYGKEGSGKNRNSYSCIGIIRQPTPATGQTHGCPFKYMNPQQLEALIKMMNPEISAKDLSEIKEAAKSNPGIACATLFNTLHPNHELDETGVSHPNIYFSESEERYREEKK